MTTRKHNKVLVIGWDAADWKVINPLMDDGAMPNLKKMVDQGVMSDISTLHPVLSPMLWTSIATGKRPFNHGILGFIEPASDGMSVQPITNLSRTTKAIWNIANQNNMRSIVVGWWPSHPAEPINGVMVSNNYHKVVSNKLDQPWPMNPGTVHPAKMGEELQEFRLHPEELSEKILRLFIPKAEEIDQVKDKRLWTLANQICEATTIQAAATWLMEKEDWDFAAVYFDAIDHFSHAFMRYHPPRREDVSEEDFELFKNVVRCGYIYHDMMLGSMLSMVDDDTTVILLSDHGFHADHLRKKDIPKEPAGPAVEHRDYGIFVMKGPGIKQDELIHGVNLLDITPTILTTMGLPVGEDMDGRVITEAFQEMPDVETIPSWDDVEGDSGQHPKGMKLDANESKEAIKQLVDLGYVEPLDDDQEKNVAMATDELNYNLARSYMDAFQFGDAVELLHEIYCRKPTEYRYGIQLAMCFKALNRHDDLDVLTQRLRQQRFSDAAKAKQELGKFRALAVERNQERLEKIQELHPELAGESIDLSKIDIADLPEELKGNLFSMKEQIILAHLTGLSRVNKYAIDFLNGFANVYKGNVEEGIQQLKDAIILSPDRPGLHLQLGDVYLKQRDWESAKDCFERAHELDPDSPQAIFGLGRCQLGMKNNREAVEFLLQSVGQLFHNPQAHYYLGIAFHRMRNVDRALDAFNLSISQNPNNAQAYSRLGYIHKHALNDLKKANEYFQLANEARDNTRELKQKASQFEIPEFDETNNDALSQLTIESIEPPRSENMLPTLAQSTLDDIKQRVMETKEVTEFVTIVTGLPRTGTSMAMQMLNNGGLEAMTDGNRLADDDNPKGYFELDTVKSLSKNNLWVHEANGKVIKVVVQLIPFLPKELNYKVIFMDRAIDEVLDSQQVLLDRNKQKGGNLTSDQLRTVLVKQLRSTIEMLRKNRITTVRVPYKNVIEDPRRAAETLQKFLNLDLNIDKMADSVDPSLYRQRKTEIETT